MLSAATSILATDTTARGAPVKYGLKKYLFGIAQLVFALYIWYVVPRHKNINQYSTGQCLHGIFVLRKSFDTVFRMGLSYDFLQSNIPTNMLDIIVLANCIPRTSAEP